MNKMISKSEVTNGAKQLIDMSQPYTVSVEITGVCDMLFHAWNAEAVDEKAASAKNSKQKKTDNLESYVYRNHSGEICLPGVYLKGTIVNAAKFRQDPRSPRKSAMDLYKAGVIPLTINASLGVKDWDYEHRCRVVIQRNGVNRTRPAMKTGWKANFDFLIQTPEYIHPSDFQDVLTNSGRLIGIADFRPTYGRFNVTRFEIINPQE